MKYTLVNMPLLGSTFQRVYKKIERKRGFSNSKDYWINRYEIGDDSGPGSYNKLAEFKSKEINAFVAEHNIKTVVEFGSGDGNQLKFAKYYSYVGYDISPRAVKVCQKTYKKDSAKNFYVLTEDHSEITQADITLSLDVIFHLTEDEAFESYMKLLFDTSKKFVCIYSSNTNEQKYGSFCHVRHREFSKWIESNRSTWQLVKTVKNPYPYNGNDEESSFADFYFYKR